MISRIPSSVLLSKTSTKGCFIPRRPILYRAELLKSGRVMAQSLKILLSLKSRRTKVKEGTENEAKTEKIGTVKTVEKEIGKLFHFSNSSRDRKRKRSRSRSRSNSVSSNEGKKDSARASKSED